MFYNWKCWLHWLESLRKAFSGTLQQVCSSVLVLSLSNFPEKIVLTQLYDYFRHISKFGVVSLTSVYYHCGISVNECQKCVYIKKLVHKCNLTVSTWSSTSSHWYFNKNYMKFHVLCDRWAAEGFFNKSIYTLLVLFLYSLVFFLWFWIKQNMVILLKRNNKITFSHGR